MFVPSFTDNHNNNLTLHLEMWTQPFRWRLQLYSSVLSSLYAFNEPCSFSFIWAEIRLSDKRYWVPASLIILTLQWLNQDFETTLSVTFFLAKLLRFIVKREKNIAYYQGLETFTIHLVHFKYVRWLVAYQAISDAKTEVQKRGLQCQCFLFGKTSFVHVHITTCNRSCPN